MKGIPRLRSVSVASLLAMLAAVSACAPGVVEDTDPMPTSLVRWPATDVYEAPDQLREATMVWSAEPGIDLFSAEGTLVRASEESFAIGLMLGLDYTYVGFAESSNSPRNAGSLSGFRDDTGQGPFVGTIYGHIQQIIPTREGFDVLSCVLGVGLDRVVNGKYSPSLLTGSEGGEQRSRFIRNGSSESGLPTSPPAALRSRDRHWQAPTGNEFEGWEIDGFIDLDPQTSERGRCVPWARSLYPNAPSTITPDTYARDTPPPVQPAFPGWPDGSS
ncbi:hypothetical protein CH293_19985 [Rhodococcus sp. 14-2470-1b]|nr:hypothetical protein CH293_19985 [Rhodococcus sp. 14-2470-1b]